jgi:hypothetical protein
MTKLNRFPLLGLWAREAAGRLGYTKAEAESLGHGYAILYAIRARGRPKAHKPKEAAAEKPRRKKAAEATLSFGGDDLPITHTADGKVRAVVGGEREQTPQSYAASVAAKFPDGYYDKVKEAFRKVVRTVPPRQLDSRHLYNLYDQWKKVCGNGRLVDLDKLLDWCAKEVRRAKD